MLKKLTQDYVLAATKDLLLDEKSGFDKLLFATITARLEMSDILDLLVKVTDAQTLINAYEDWEMDNVPTTEPETAYQKAMWKREAEELNREFEANQAVKEVVKHG